MGICCFSCALKAAEIFHIRGLLYKKGWSGLGFAGRKNSSGDDSSNKKLSPLSTLVGIASLCSSSDFPSQFSLCTNQKHLPVCPWCVPGSSSPAPVSLVTAELCAHPGCIAGIRAGLGCVWAQRCWGAAVLWQGLVEAVMGIHLIFFDIWNGDFTHFSRIPD